MVNVGHKVTILPIVAVAKHDLGGWHYKRLEVVNNGYREAPPEILREIKGSFFYPQHQHNQQTNVSKREFSVAIAL